MSDTPMNNLTQNKTGDTSLKPGVSGESVNAPYGPKAACEDGIEKIKDWGNETHERGGVK